MELYGVMRTTSAAREFTDDPLPNETLFKILDNGRFAPSGQPPGLACHEQTPTPARLTEPLLRAAVVLVVCVDLKVVASTDQYLKRVGVVGGGTVTTLAIAQEPKLQELLGIPRHVAVCAIMPLGRPVKQLMKLKRKAVPEFTMLERWGGQPLTATTP